jgi:hypothetical protein
MYSSLTEMLATSHRDQLRRQASQHRLAREARQSRRDTAPRNAARTSPNRFLHCRLADRRSELRPAAA